MTHIKKYGAWYLFAIAVAILLYMIFSANKPEESHRTESGNLNNDEHILRDSLTEERRRNAINENALIVINNNLRSKNIEADATRRELDKTKLIANRLASEVKSLQPEDTSEYSHKVDSLIIQSDNLTYLIHSYEQAVDSLSNLYDQQKITYENMISDKVKINELIRTSYDKVKTSYDGLYTDYGKLSKSLKRERLKTKVAAVIGLAAIGFLIAK